MINFIKHLNYNFDVTIINLDKFESRLENTINYLKKKGYQIKLKDNEIIFNRNINIISQNYRKEAFVLIRSGQIVINKLNNICTIVISVNILYSIIFNALLIITLSFSIFLNFQITTKSIFILSIFLYLLTYFITFLLIKHQCKIMISYFIKNHVNILKSLLSPEKLQIKKRKSKLI